MTDEISMCLPKGGAMEPLAKLLDEVRFPVEDYNSNNRTYRLKIKDLPVNVRAKIMAEKDVAIQIATGNYDIGFCGMYWVQEHTSRYRAAKLHVFKRLGLDKKEVYTCSGLNSDIESVDDLHRTDGFVTIISEYPNLAENFAIRNQLRKFKIFSAWGSVEAYPPEHADLVLIAVDNKDDLHKMGLQPIAHRDRDIESDLCLIVNRKSFVEKNLAPVLEFFQKDLM
ncbi:MAG: ATP phosphoribosyltransferase [bacterium]|nr:ATP phosphoribosyltransferase [bacterium]